MPDPMCQADLSFVVGLAFPIAGDEKHRSTVLVRFVLAVRPLLFLQRAVASLPQDSPTCPEDFNVAMALCLGAAKEAIDAFRNAEADKFLDEFFSPEMLKTMKEEDAHAVVAAYESLRRACDKQSSSYLFMENMRNNAGFHWGTAAVEKVLVTMAERRYRFRQGGPSHLQTCLPFTADLVDELRQATLSEEEAGSLAVKLATLCFDLVRVSHHVFAVRVLASQGLR
jgi:hypothetical protein